MPSVASLLLVEPDDLTRGPLEAAASPLARVESHRDFQTARARLLVTSFDFLLTNVRLNAYNGLHLVYLSSCGPTMPCAIVYSEKRDPSLGRDIHRAGAFYEIASCLPVTLAAYLKARLLVRDRRDPALFDRRRLSRGGRRCWDHYLDRGQQ